MDGIARRRAEDARLKKQRQIWWGRRLPPELVSRAVDTPTPCSCWMCGNPRKYFRELSRQELKLKALAESQDAIPDERYLRATPPDLG
jgi:hypothetical protein